MGKDDYKFLTLSTLFKSTNEAIGQTKEEQRTPEARQAKADEIFIRLTGEKQEDFETEPPPNLYHGPLTKNQADFDFEFIVESLCNPKTKDTIKIFHKNNQYKVSVDNKEFNLSEILQNMDGRFTTISQDAKKYFYDNTDKTTIMQMEKCYNKNKIIFFQKHPELKQEENAFDKQHNDLEPSEKIALYLYTSNEIFYPMIDLLRGTPPKDFMIHGKPLSSYSNENFDLFIKNIILLDAMALSGLNKLPDHTIKQSYRVEQGIPERIADKEKSITNPNYVVRERGFISTSKTGAKTTGNQIIMFHNLIGKDISAFSAFSFETEFLIPPTQIKYEAKETVNGIDYYIAKPVFTLEGLTPEQAQIGLTQEQIAEKIISLLQNAIKEYHVRSNQQQKESFNKALTKQFRILTGAHRLDSIKERIFSTLLNICQTQRDNKKPIDIASALEETKQQLLASKQDSKITENDFNKAIDSPLGKHTKSLIEELKQITTKKKQKKSLWKKR